MGKWSILFFLMLSSFSLAAQDTITWKWGLLRPKLIYQGKKIPFNQIWKLEALYSQPGMPPLCAEELRKFKALRTTSGILAIAGTLCIVTPVAVEMLGKSALDWKLENPLGTAAGLTGVGLTLTGAGLVVPSLIHLRRSVYHFNNYQRIPKPML